MVLQLDIPEWRPPSHGGSSSWGDEEDTPREPREPRPAGSLPASPSARKTKSRAARTYARSNSLRDAKVLVVSDMHRTESAMDPDLFQYHQHFESPWHLVGKTSLSEVFRVRHSTNGEVFAVKRSRRRFRSKLQRERCMREILAVAALPTHPNIVNQHRAWQEGGHFYIQMDYCEGGSLAQWTHKACMQGQRMSDAQLWSTACQAAQGLLFLHSHGVMHLDVKPDNLYLSAGGAAGNPGAAAGWATCRIGDFGLAVAREADGHVDWEEGDGDYVAPELLAAGGEPTPAADIFSLGATLYECATGQRLPRSEGWTAADVAALQVDDRPAAFVQLLRAMLQPHPALRPSAKQVVETVAQEQPEVALAAQEAVDAAAEAARVEDEAAQAALAARQAAAAQQQQQQQHKAVASPDQPRLQPSPFLVAAAMKRESSASPPPATETDSPRAAGAADQFSFDVPQQCPPTGGKAFAFTPGQPVRSHSRRSGSSGTPGSGIKSRGPSGRSRVAHPRWAPALSPLISEGALTPGAAAALAGLTPPPRCRLGSGDAGDAPTPQLGQAQGGGGGGSSGVTPLDIWRPAPLQVPPQTAAQAIFSSGSGGMLAGSSGRGSGGTRDSRDGWRLSRRDVLSPDSDYLNGSHSESDYSYSCGTGRTTSDMEFADAASPMSADLGFLRAGPTPSSGTPESVRLQSCTPGSGSQQPTPSPLQPTPSPQQQQQLAAEAPQHEGAAGAAAPAPRLLQAAPSLAWDLHTSPEFLMQLAPSSPDSLSRCSSLDDTSSLPSRGLSVRRFPTLDSWGSQLDAACSRPPPRADSLAALAAQRLTNTFVQQQPSAPAGADTLPADAVEQGAGGRGLRKRQHSSRRTLMAALSRDNSVASSIDGMAPLVKARHIMEAGDGSSPDHSPLHPLHRAASHLARGSAAALAGGPAGPAAAAGVASGDMEVVGDESLELYAATPSHHLLREMSFGPSDARTAAAVAVAHEQARLAAPPSPLHARMTGLKLRSVD